MTLTSARICTLCCAVSRHDNFPRVGRAHGEGIDDIGSILDEIKVTTPILYGLEDLSCLRSAFSDFDLAGRVRCTLPRASTVRLLRGPILGVRVGTRLPGAET